MPLELWENVDQIHISVYPKTKPVIARKLDSLTRLASETGTELTIKHFDFFRVSYPTKGLRSLLEDVLSRLTGGTGNRILKLLTPFGGGKSHTLAAIGNELVLLKASRGVALERVLNYLT